MNAKKVVHRNVNPANLLVVGGDQIKLTGFRFASKIETSNFDVPKNTWQKNYTPPETDEDLPEKERKSHDTEENRLKIDSWSLGTILYQLCVGIYPFKSL